MQGLCLLSVFHEKAVQRGAIRLHNAIKVLETARIMKKSIKFSMLTFFISSVMFLRYAFPSTRDFVVRCRVKHMLLVSINIFVFFHKTEV